MRLLLLALVCSCTALAAHQPGNTGGLKVIIIDGDEAANVVQEKIAAEPVIEVRDDDERRVAGAVVRFLIRRTALGNRVPAIFGNGREEVRTLTDDAGRATTSLLTPLEPGRFEIEIQVSHQGRSATTTIRHTNFSTTTQARLAGREPGQSSGSTPGQAAAASGGAAPAAAGAAAGGATAATAGGSALTKLAVGGLVLGGAAGGAYYALARESGAAAAAQLGAIIASQSVGLEAATPITFSVPAADFDGSPTYDWEFGDGGTSNELSPTYVYRAAGSYTVGVTVSDARQSARSETSVTIHTVTGTWLAGATTMPLTQSGLGISGSFLVQPPDSSPPHSCSVSGFLQAGTPAVIIVNRPACPHPQYTPIPPAEYRFTMTQDGQTLVGTVNGVSMVPWRRQP